MTPKPTNPLLMYVWPSKVVLSPAGMAGLAEGLLGAGRAEAGVARKVEEIRAAVWRAMRTTILRKGQIEGGGGRSMLRSFFTLPLLPLYTVCLAHRTVHRQPWGTLALEKRPHARFRGELGPHVGRPAGARRRAKVQGSRTFGSEGRSARAIAVIRGEDHPRGW